MVKNKVKY